jgi:hypothetical protein
MLEPSSFRIVNYFERIDRYIHMFLLILSRHDLLALGLESHMHFGNTMINCSKIQQNATRFKYIGRSLDLGETRLQTPNKRVFLHMSKSWATKV